MLKIFSPFYFRKKIILLYKEMKGYDIFKKVLPEAAEDTFFQRYRKRFVKGKLYLGIDMLPELKVYKRTDLEIENEEKKRLAIEVSKFNDVFGKYGILEMIMIVTERIDTDDFYGFILEIGYKFNQARLKTYSYLFFYSLGLITFIVGLAVLIMSFL